MKIGILTYHRAYNYGAYLQAYAFTQQLSRRFPEDQIELVDFAYRYDVRKRKRNLLKVLLKFGLTRYRQNKHISDTFESSITQLPLGKRIVTNNTKKAVEQISKLYDFVIVGSDAVFNWTTNPLPNVYFFQTDRCPHVSYAASAHLNRYRDASETEAAFVRSALSKFRYIGTRDRETENFVCHFGAEVSAHNCDPTVVLELDYETPMLTQKMKAQGIEPGEPIICLMLKRRKYAEIIRKRFGDRYKLVAVKNENPYADVFLDNLTPLEWSRVFQYAALTVTDFFHGSLLSLKNGTPVISIDTSGYTEPYEAKAKDLFYNRLQLPSFYFVGEDMEELGQRCEQLLSGDWTERIRTAMEEEGKSFAAFCDMLEPMLEEYRKNER